MNNFQWYRFPEGGEENRVCTEIRKRKEEAMEIMTQ
jgi:hypothetical protein